MFYPRFVLSLFNGAHDIELSERALGHMLEALAKIHEDYLRAFPDTPLLYDLGVRYERQAEGQEDWYDVPSGIYAGKTDCKVLACWRVAELRRAKVAAEPAFIRYDNPDGTYLFHILVRYPDGTLEDPSAMLGMMAIQ